MLTTTSNSHFTRNFEVCELMMLSPPNASQDDNFQEEALAEEIHEPAPAAHDVLATAAVVPRQQDLAVQVGERIEAQLSAAKRLVEAGTGSNRVRDGWRAMRAEEQSVDPVIPHSRFTAFAKQRRGLEPDAIKFGQDALHTLQVFTEAACEHFMQDSAMLAEHARRITVHANDLQTVVALRRRWGDPCFSERSLRRQLMELRLAEASLRSRPRQSSSGWRHKRSSRANIRLNFFLRWMYDTRPLESFTVRATVS